MLSVCGPRPASHAHFRHRQPCGSKNNSNDTAEATRARTDLVGGDGHVDGVSDSDLVLGSHGQRVVGAGLQVLNADTSVCAQRRHTTDRFGD